MRTSNAYKLPAFTEQSIQELPKKIQGGLAKRIKRQRVKTILAIAAITLVAATIMIRYAQINVVNNQIQSLKKQLDNSYTQVANLTLEIDRSIDLPTVEEIATKEYGMVKPTKEQVVYITVTQDDMVDVVKKTGFTATIKSMFGF